MAVVVRPVVGLRSGPRPEAEMVTQEIWGREVEALCRRGLWVRAGAVDGMRGWVPAGALTEDSSYIPTHIVRKRFTVLRPARVLLPMGSVVRVEGRSGRYRRVGLPGKGTGRVKAADLAELGRWRPRFKDLVREVIGTPYLWGGKSTFGFDCSGLVQFMFECLGISLPRDSREQATEGRRIGTLARLRPLDLVFFKRGRRIDHVAVHTGGLEILHASGHVKFESLKPEDPRFRQDLRERFAWATRIL
jgi:cell wall-associated NlpC family hydrolase